MSIAVTFDTQPHTAPVHHDAAKAGLNGLSECVVGLATILVETRFARTIIYGLKGYSLFSCEFGHDDVLLIRAKG